MERLRRWLTAVPDRDPVERRQAYLLQAFLLIVATAFIAGAVANALRSVASGDSITGVLPNAEAAAILGVLAAVLRRGWFQLVAGATMGFLVYAFAQPLAGSDRSPVRTSRCSCCRWFLRA